MEGQGTANIPRQKLPSSKKTKKWGEECVDAYIGLSSIGGYSAGYSNRRDALKRFYDFYNGEIETQDYDYVLKPYGKTRKNFPSKIRNYPIIKPIIDLLLGEKSKRPFNYTVTVTNSDAITTKAEAKKQAIFMNLQNRFVQDISRGNPEMSSEEMAQDPQTSNLPEDSKGMMQELPEHIAEMFDMNYKDIRAIKGQQALSYIQKEQEIQDKFEKAWFHFLVSGECYTHRGVRSSEPFYEVINPLDVDYDLDPDLEFVEDGDWALVRKFSHSSTIIDQFHEYLSSANIDKLEEPNSNYDNWMLYNSGKDDKDADKSRLIEAITVYWKSRRRIGFLAYIDPSTETWEEMEVGEDFKMLPEMKEMGAKLEWVWVNEVWEGTRIDKDIYVKVQPVINQRGSIDNPSKCKLPINGRKYSNVNSSNISLVSLGVPYQLNYNIYKYRLELAIARSKDIIAQFDINMIPKKWDMDKFMYYVEGTGIAWVDYNKEGIQLNPQHQSVMDMSIKTIEQYIMLLESINIEWEKLSGVNRQRQGTVGPYEGKAVAQQAILQSSHITEDYFKKFSRMEQRDLQAMLDYSKEAWLGGKKTMYVMSDGTTDFLDLESLQHMESEYSVFVGDSGKDTDKLQQIQQLAHAMLQNGVPSSTIAEMLDTESFTQLKEKIASAESAAEELAQQQQEAQMQMQQQQMQQQMQTEQMKLQNENEQNELDRRNKVEIAMINAESKDDGGESNYIKTQKDIKDQQLREREINLRERDVSEKSRTNVAKESEAKRTNQENEKIKKDANKNRSKPK